MNTIDRIERVLDSVFEGEIDASGVTEESDLREDVGLSSVAMLYMVMGLEEEFGIKFTNADFEKMTTVGDVVACIEGKLK